MDALTRKKVAVITKYVTETFSAADWHTLGQLSGRLDLITSHPRLLRSLGFGDDDYDACAAEVLNTIFAEDQNLVEDVIDHFDIGLWYQQKEPEKHKKLFFDAISKSPDFWKEGCLRLFVSHLASNEHFFSR